MLPAKPLTASGAKRCHEFETDLGDAAVRQTKIRRSNKINMSRGVRAYRAQGLPQRGNTSQAATGVAAALNVEILFQ
jgi:hypothetical protein